MLKSLSFIIIATIYLMNPEILQATTYYSDYGQSRTNNINVTASTHSFEVNGIAINKHTEWYVNGIYKETDNSGLLAIDPNYTYTFSSGTVEIKAIVYNDTNPWTVKETHIWNVTVPTPPTVTTNTASSITTRSVRLNGTVNPNGTSTTYYFQYGKTTSYGTQTSTVNAGSGTSNLSVMENIDYLEAGTTYHYRIVATNTNGTSYGNDVSFTTTALTINMTAPTSNISVVQGNTVMLTWSGSPSAGTSVSLYWDNDRVWGNSGGGLIAVTQPISGSYSWNTTGVATGTYYLVAVITDGSTNKNAYASGSVTITGPKPTVTTNTASSITTRSVRLNGTVNPNGTSTTYYFQYGKTTSYGSQTSTVNAGSGTSNLSVTENKDYLEAGTTYHYRIVATNTNGTSYGNDVSFTTTALAINMTAPTSNISVVQGNTVTLTWSGSPTTGTSVSLYWDNDRVWGNSGGGLIEIGQPISGNYTWNTTGVATGTYYFVAVITDGSTNKYSYASGSVTIKRTGGVNFYVQDQNSQYKEGALVRIYLDNNNVVTGIIQSWGGVQLNNIIEGAYYYDVLNQEAVNAAQELWGSGQVTINGGEVIAYTHKRDYPYLNSTILGNQQGTIIDGVGGNVNAGSSLNIEVNIKNAVTWSGFNTRVTLYLDRDKIDEADNTQILTYTFSANEPYKFSFPYTVPTNWGGSKLYIKVKVETYINNSWQQTEIVNYDEGYYFNIIGDNTPPTVLSTTPAANETNVSVNSHIYVELSEDILASSINTNSFQVLLNGVPINGTIEQVGIPNAYKFIPERKLLFDKTYICKLSTNITDLSGKTLDGNSNSISEGSPLDDYSFQFTTEKLITPKIKGISVTQFGNKRFVTIVKVVSQSSSPIDPNTVKLSYRNLGVYPSEDSYWLKMERIENSDFYKLEVYDFMNFTDFFVNQEVVWKVQASDLAGNTAEWPNKNVDEEYFFDSDQEYPDYTHRVKIVDENTIDMYRDFHMTESGSGIISFEKDGNDIRIYNNTRLWYNADISDPMLKETATSPNIIPLELIKYTLPHDEGIISALLTRPSPLIIHNVDQVHNFDVSLDRVKADAILLNSIDWAVNLLKSVAPNLKNDELRKIILYAADWTPVVLAAASGDLEGTSAKVFEILTGNVVQTIIARELSNFAGLEFDMVLKKVEGSFSVLSAIIDQFLATLSAIYYPMNDIVSFTKVREPEIIYTDMPGILNSEDKVYLNDNKGFSFNVALDRDNYQTYYNVWFTIDIYAPKWGTILNSELIEVTKTEDLYQGAIELTLNKYGQGNTLAYDLLSAPVQTVKPYTFSTSSKGFKYVSCKSPYFYEIKVWQGGYPNQPYPVEANLLSTTGKIPFYILDNIGPNIPSVSTDGLISSSNTISFSINKGSEIDLLQYEVYKKTANEDVYELLTILEVPDNMDKLFFSEYVDPALTYVFYKVRAVDISNNKSDFSQEIKFYPLSLPNITVRNPNSSVNWTIGSQQAVNWTSSNVTGNINIKLSTDGGSTYPVTLASNTANDGSENITVPNNPSTTCRIRVEAVSEPSVYGVSPGYFTITTSPTINVSLPIAGSSWTVGSSQIVSWTSSNVTGNVNIKLSTDGGSTYPVTLATNTANDGSENITVPNNPSTNCRIRVESASNTSVYGNNPGSFSITNNILSLPFVDNFTTGPNSNWEVVGNQWAFENGKVYVNVNVPYTTGSMSIGNQSWSNYTFETELEGINGPDKQIQFYRTNSENYYYLHMLGPYDINRLELGKLVAGQYTTIIYKDYPVINNSLYKLKIRLYNGTIQVMVNNTLEIDVVDNTFSNGGIALSGGSGGIVPNNIIFDNVSVTPNIYNIDFTVNPMNIDFGYVNNNTIEVDTVRIINELNSKDNLIGTISITGTRFAILKGGGNFNIGPGEGIETIIWFNPDQMGSYEENLFITHNSNKMTSPLAIPIRAEVVTGNDDVISKMNPDVFELSNNFPNPFNPTTKIFYSVPLETEVKISVYNSLGEEIINLVDGVKSPGNYVINFHSDQLVSGMYFYRMQAGNFVDIKKMILLK